MKCSLANSNHCGAHRLEFQPCTTNYSRRFEGTSVSVTLGKIWKDIVTDKYLEASVVCLSLPQDSLELDSQEHNFHVGGLRI